MFDLGIFVEDFKAIVGAVPRTLAMAVAIFVMATILGAVLALIERNKVPVLSQLLVAYKIALKGTPMIIIIFLAYYGIPGAVRSVGGIVGVHIGAHAIANWMIIILALTLTLAAFQSEVVRGAMKSFDSGQADAAYSLGYKKRQVLTRIMLPQITMEAIPDLANSFMVIMKALSLAFAIEVVDIFAQAQLTAALNFYYLEAFLTAVLIYLVIAFITTQIADRSEQALRRRT